MAQITIDTNSDTIEEMEHAILLIKKAIERKGKISGVERQEKAPLEEQSLEEQSSEDKRAVLSKNKLEMPSTPVVEEETAVDTPFLKITVKSEEHKKEVPTLNELLTDEQLTEDDLKKLYKEVIPEVEKKEANQKDEKKQNAFIEIIEYEEEK
jgi:hypothetical protein